MIKVLIKRTIAEGLESNYEHTIVELLKHAKQSPGYINGESFRDAQKSNEYIVISTWESVNAWNLWFRSPGRMKMLKEIGVFLKEPEKFTILEPCLYSRVSALETH